MRKIPHTFVPLTIVGCGIAFMSEARAVQPSLELFNKCISIAISHDNVTQTGNTLSYLCDNKIAERYFNYLVSNGHQKFEMKDQSKGLFMSIEIGFENSACYHQIENADGTSASDFSCVISMRAPQN